MPAPRSVDSCTPCTSPCSRRRAPQPTHALLSRGGPRRVSQCRALWRHNRLHRSEALGRWRWLGDLSWTGGLSTALLALKLPRFFLAGTGVEGKLFRCASQRRRWLRQQRDLWRRTRSNSSGGGNASRAAAAPRRYTRRRRPARSTADRRPARTPSTRAPRLTRSRASRRSCRTARGGSGGELITVFLVGLSLT